MFTITKEKNGIRQGVIHTQHGDIITPAFLPDATYGSVKAVSFPDVLNTGIEQVLLTTLHMHIAPGDRYIKRMGGLHNFLSWERPILTDSGGWQVFSLIHQTGNGKVTEDGAEFIMPNTNKKHLLTPELSIDIQANLRSDIIVALDDPIIGSASKKDNEYSINITSLWAQRAKKHFLKRYNLTEEKFNKPEKYKRPLLFCVVQGGNYKELRKQSAEELAAIGFDGFGYGGILLKDDVEGTRDMLKFFSEIVPEDKVRYGMGVGRLEDIKFCIENGYDLFDSVVPTRNARHGYCYTSFGGINLKSAKYKYDNHPIDQACDCEACRYINKRPAANRAYLWHLLKMKEMSGMRLCSIHNLHHYKREITKYGRL